MSISCLRSRGMEFVLNDEQQALRDMLRTFVAKEVRPNAGEWDASAEFPRETVAKLGELGLLGAMVPEEYGGSGMDMLSYAVAVEEISKGDGSLGLTVASHNSLCTAHILGFGSEAVKRKYLPGLASGRALGAWALTEPGSGSDSLAMRTKAEWKKDRWVINGNKMFITQGNVAGVYVVLAVTDRDKGKDGVTAFVFPPGTKGLSVGKKLHKLGMRSSDTAELVFEDLEVGPDAVVGQVNSGFRDTMKNLAGGRISIAALSVGIGLGAMREALAYSKEREQFGHAVSEFQAIQWMFADMGTEREAAELMTFRAASLKDAGRPYTREAAMAKLLASEAAMDTRRSTPPSGTCATRSCARSGKGPRRCSGSSSPATSSGVTERRDRRRKGDPRRKHPGRGAADAGPGRRDPGGDPHPEGAVPAHGARLHPRRDGGARRGNIDPRQPDHHASAKARKVDRDRRDRPDEPFLRRSHPRRPDPDAAACARRGSVHQEPCHPGTSWGPVPFHHRHRECHGRHGEGRHHHRNGRRGAGRGGDRQGGAHQPRARRSGPRGRHPGDQGGDPRDRRHLRHQQVGSGRSRQGETRDRDAGFDEQLQGGGMEASRPLRCRCDRQGYGGTPRGRGPAPGVHLPGGE